VLLFEPFHFRSLSLQNRTVMAPMTRNRATPDHLPNELMVEYYAQRASLGLIITEGTSPSDDGLGYARIPGIANAEQAAGWRPIVEAVHERGAKIFLQLMHTGRASNVDNMPAGSRVVSSTTVPLPDPIYTDTQGLQPASPPHALSVDEIAVIVEEYAEAARLAILAGFDGVELHAANGYLIEQFLNPIVNTRTDSYGGSLIGRNRFAIEIMRACAKAVGPDRVGVRISPYGVFNGTGAFADVDTQYIALVTEMSILGLITLHLVDHESMGAPPVPQPFRTLLREAFTGVFIASGGLNQDSGEALLQSGTADLIAFGRASLANPDLVDRMLGREELNAPDMSTFYTPGPAGYVDYPEMSVVR
jgi:N-ethylmaleimide reductase